MNTQNLIAIFRDEKRYFLFQQRLHYKCMAAGGLMYLVI